MYDKVTNIFNGEHSHRSPDSIFIGAVQMRHAAVIKGAATARYAMLKENPSVANIAQAMTQAAAAEHAPVTPAYPQPAAVESQIAQIPQSAEQSATAPADDSAARLAEARQAIADSGAHSTSNFIPEHPREHGAVPPSGQTVVYPLPQGAAPTAQPANTDTIDDALQAMHYEAA